MKYRAIKGTRDILPAETPRWQRVERHFREVFARYGYREIRLPVFEETALFARGLGDSSDIVEKEMYTFPDKGGNSLTLRPEGTAGVVRAFLENSLGGEGGAVKLWYAGPMFRYERPQSGRQRQFHQIGAELFGVAGPEADAELLQMVHATIAGLGVPGLTLQVNSLGDAACRPAFRQALIDYFRPHAPELCDNCRRRLETNPLRVLDSKAPEDQPVVAELPRILDHLCEPCREHFAEVRRQLDLLGISYRLSHRLVRGLDYYVRTTFEVTSDRLGSQSSVIGGGRYDGLVKDLGGPDAAGVGFAVGMERLALLVPSPGGRARCDVFLMPVAKAALDPALRLQRELRQAGLRAMLDPEGRSFKSRMKQADKLGARFVAILGDDEIARGVWTVRDMARSEQQDVPEERILEHLKEKANG